jgi:hypothetical protein
MSYSCSDCEDGVLEAKIRELELEDGETVTVLEDGRAIASKVACSNEECRSHAAEEDGEKERGTCGVRGCIKEAGHEGRHKSPPKEEGAE